MGLYDTAYVFVCILCTHSHTVACMGVFTEDTCGCFSGLEEVCVCVFSLVGMCTQWGRIDLCLSTVCTCPSVTVTLCVFSVLTRHCTVKFKSNI